MRLVWTKSSLPLSVVIRAVTGEDCSHFAFVFESAAKGIMFESNLLGTHPKFWANAQKHLTVVHEIDLPMSTEDEDRLWDIVVQHYDGKSYDFLGIVYLGLCVLRERLFKIKRPNSNAWASSDKFFCDEIYAAINQLGLNSIPIIDAANGMDTPHDVFEKVKGHNALRVN
jgi:hypothetical protein